MYSVLKVMFAVKTTNHEIAKCSRLNFLLCIFYAPPRSFELVRAAL